MDCIYKALHLFLCGLLPSLLYFSAWAFLSLCLPFSQPVSFSSFGHLSMSLHVFLYLISLSLSLSLSLCLSLSLSPTVSFYPSLSLSCPLPCQLSLFLPCVAPKRLLAAPEASRVNPVPPLGWSAPILRVAGPVAAVPSTEKEGERAGGGYQGRFAQERPGKEESNLLCV